MKDCNWVREKSLCSLKARCHLRLHIAVHFERTNTGWPNQEKHFENTVHHNAENRCINGMWQLSFIDESKRTLVLPASSRQRYLQTSSVTIFLLSMSINRPGVATRMWTPRRITSSASELGTPPMARQERISRKPSALMYDAKYSMFSWIWMEDFRNRNEFSFKLSYFTVLTSMKQYV